MIAIPLYCVICRGVLSLLVFDVLPPTWEIVDVSKYKARAGFLAISPISLA